MSSTRTCSTPRTGVILIDAALAGEWDIFRNAFGHLILPASLLGYLSLAYIARMTRSFMIEQLRQEYVTTALIKGRSFQGAVWRHAFPNILVPLITVIGLSYAALLEGAVLTETVFAWPGLGLYITHSLFNADMNAVLGGTLVVGAVFIAHQSDLRLPLPARRSAAARGLRLDGMNVNTAAKPRLMRWLDTDDPASHWQAFCASLFAGARAILANPLAFLGLVIVVGLIGTAAFAPLLARGFSPLSARPRRAAAAAERRPLVRHRRTRPRHLRPHRLRRARDARHRRSGRRPSSCRSA